MDHGGFKGDPSLGTTVMDCFGVYWAAGKREGEGRLSVAPSLSGSFTACCLIFLLGLKDGAR